MYDYELEQMAKALEQKGLLIPVLEPEQAVQTVKEEMKKYWEDKIAVVWTTEDVLSIAHPAKWDTDGNEIPAEEWLTQEDAVGVLNKVLDDHDATLGITWDTIEIYVSDFKAEKQKKDTHDKD
jgi:hypothetical protein